MDKPNNAIGYARLSELRRGDLNEDGQGKGTVDQVERIERHADRIGWRVGRMIVENDLSPGRGKNRTASAFKRRRITLPNGRVELRTVRPGFRGALDDLASGRHDGFLALDLDRTVRDPRDLEDLIDVVEEHQVPVESVTGSLRLANDADITMARVMVAVANKESRDKTRRVTAARQRQAVHGEFGGGRRPFGFEADGITIRPGEATIIAECSQRLVQGASVRSLAADLRQRGIPSITGLPWTASTLRRTLLRPRNAGRVVYQGEEIGNAPWTPLVPLETFRAVQRILTDPSRRLSPGPARRWLGSGLYLCGVCDDGTPMYVRGGKGQPVYRCARDGHLQRRVRNVDRLVVGTAIARLSRPDAIDLITPADSGVDVAALRAEVSAIRDNLNELAADKALGLIDRAQLITATARGQARMEEIERLLHQTTVESPLVPLVGIDDVATVWEGLPLTHQHMVLDALMVVRILPTNRRGPTFDPTSVEITWKG